MSLVSFYPLGISSRDKTNLCSVRRAIIKRAHFLNRRSMGYLAGRKERVKPGLRRLGPTHAELQLAGCFGGISL